jgi:hypothetical protein
MIYVTITKPSGRVVTLPLPEGSTVRDALHEVTDDRLSFSLLLRESKRWVRNDDDTPIPLDTVLTNNDRLYLIPRNTS